jgi:membrane protein required for beta-lactamase induction
MLYPHLQIWLSKIEHVSVPVHVVILALYIHLRLGEEIQNCSHYFIKFVFNIYLMFVCLGQKDIAITLIKQNCPQAKR